MERQKLQVARDVAGAYADVLTPDVLVALQALCALDQGRKELMATRSVRCAQREADQVGVGFLPPDDRIAGTAILVSDAREGKFLGAEIPDDLRRQWIQGTGPAARPGVSQAKSLRNAAYALLSGADGWMFDGEDALGQLGHMSLDNQRNLTAAIGRSPLFLEVAKQVAGQMNTWASSFLGKDIVADWQEQLDFTTVIYRARGLHLDDRHIRNADGSGFSASLVDLVCYVVNNLSALSAAGASIVLYLPKIQTAGEAALWNRMLSDLEAHLGLGEGTIKVYVLVEQLEASFQLMEIRAALGQHFVGYNTGRWDYIHSVADAMAWDRDFVHPNIDAIGMTYAYLRAYEDRVRRAVNTPDAAGNFALWQGGMEANIPVGSADGVAAGMKRALAGAAREQAAGASGKWVAHWKMVHLVRPVWEKVGQDNQLGRSFPPLTYGPDDQKALVALEAGVLSPITVRGARDLLSVGLQYGNAFLQGLAAAALKPADFFGNDDVLYLMEDMATGEIRLGILWEWLHKGAVLTEADAGSGIAAGTVFDEALFARLLQEEHQKLLAAGDRDVYPTSKVTTLPVARAIVEAYVRAQQKPPWFIDLLNLTLGVHALPQAIERITLYFDTLRERGVRVTHNPDFAGGAQ